MLAAAQPAIGAGIALVFAAGFAAACDWSAPDQRSTTLAWTILGQPAAWVVGVPLIGIVAEAGWRWAWVVAPLAASLLSLAAVARRRPEAPATGPSRGRAGRGSGRGLWRFPGARGWAAGELFAYAGWSTILIYAGTFFAESYELSKGSIGWLLGAAAAGYFPGTLLARRGLEARARTMRVASALVASGGVLTFTVARPGAATSAAVLFVLMAVVGARTMAGSSFGMHAGPAIRAGLMGARAAATQLGALAGAAVGGAALALGGFAALGIASATCLALAAAAHALPEGARREGVAAFNAPSAAAA